MLPLVTRAPIGQIFDLTWNPQSPFARTEAHGLVLFWGENSQATDPAVEKQAILSLGKAHNLGANA